MTACRPGLIFRRAGDAAISDRHRAAGDLAAGPRIEALNVNLLT
jgi:hypothetical protein